ncbi:g118 [Yersinia phage phiR1-37]|uniref:hypothetical protein n=1 Tax=Yersinia phage phiR1-37 TaxID=331278 RepID=UPI00022DBD22|nr:hypothetical protein phiR1-37_gp118 [Yersinia phage phiR1-37]CCE26142.1 g118 [Yersinia phage phiR1-37]
MSDKHVVYSKIENFFSKVANRDFEPVLSSLFGGLRKQVRWDVVFEEIRSMDVNAIPLDKFKVMSKGDVISISDNGDTIFVEDMFNGKYTLKRKQGIIEMTVDGEHFTFKDNNDEAESASFVAPVDFPPVPNGFIANIRNLLA